MPPETKVAIVAAAAVGSALLLRRSSFHQRRRPAAVAHHEITRRTRTVFVKGLVACASMAAIAGFSNVLAGYHYIEVPDSYETRLALGFMAVCTLLLLLGAATRFSIRTLHKTVTVLFAVGCLLTPFIVQLSSVSDIILSATYQAGLITLVGCVCIDVSNYYDIPATKVFGAAFAGFYMAQVVGSCAAQALTLGAHRPSTT